MRPNDFYESAHLVVAAIRILNHQNSAPPALDDIRRMLSCSLEQGNLVCRKLVQLGVLEPIDGAYGTRFFIKAHQKIEEILASEADPPLEEEIRKFQTARKNLTSRITSLQNEQAEKKKNLFAELDKQLKKGLAKK